MKPIIALVLLAAALSGCDAPPPPETKGVAREEWVTWEHVGDVGRFHDNELNVTCWLLSSGFQCLPDAATKRGSPK